MKGHTERVDRNRNVTVVTINLHADVGREEKRRGWALLLSGWIFVISLFCLSLFVSVARFNVQM